MSDSPLRRVLLIAVNLLGLAAFTWPFALPAAVGGDEAHAVDGPIVFALLVVGLGALLFVELGRGGMGPKAVALIGVLGAAMVALRLPGFIGGFSAMFIIVLVAGNAFGPGFGFALGAIGTFASGLFIGGFGPWLPFQMVAVGWVGMGAGLAPKSQNWPLRIGSLAVYGFVAGLAFGAVMNLWFWPFASYGPEVSYVAGDPVVENLRRYLIFWATTSLGWDIPRGVLSGLLVLVAGRPLLAALRRTARRAAFEEPVTFASPEDQIPHSA